jgi:putative SOS response-associated peptidase YedK
VRDLPTFRDAYRKRRCIVPVDRFFEWKAINGQKAKQPFAIAKKDGAPFGIAGIWENWKEPVSGEWTFAIITSFSTVGRSPQTCTRTRSRLRVTGKAHRCGTHLRGYC